MMPAQYFRAGVGAIIVNASRLVLALERADRPGAWQLPQGGIEGAEEPPQAVIREVAEETGIRETELKLLGRYPEPLAYELPQSARSQKTGRGQVQYWFLFEFQGADRTIDLSEAGEFRDWAWMPFKKLEDMTVEFRKSTYSKLEAWLQEKFGL